MWSAFRNFSLKYKFLIVFLVMVTLPTVCFGFFIYVQMDSVLNEQAKDSAEGMLNKIEGNLTSIIKDVEHISAYAIYNEDFRTYMDTSEKYYNESFYTESVDNVKGYLTFQLLANEYINSISVKGNNGNTINMGEPVSGDEAYWNELTAKENGRIVWSDSYELNSGWSGKHQGIEVISLSRVINDYNNISQSLGFIRIRLNVDDLREVIKLSSLEKEADVYLKDANNNNIILTSNEKPDTEEENGIIQSHTSDPGNNYIKSGGRDYLMVTRNLGNVDWDLIAVVDQKEVSEKLVNVKMLMVSVAFILILLGLIALIGYYYADIRRIIDLTKTTERMENKDFDVKVNVKSKDEIGQLGTRFNQMIRTIQNHIDKEYKLNIRQKESEMKALQSKIDPHFLYNTLDMIRWKARMEHAPETSHLIEMLSRIFRSTLRSDDLLITFKEEIMFIRSYLELQSKRMNGSLQFHLHVDSKIENVFIMKQTIQPLVENSIKHGFQEKTGEKHISIYGYMVDETVVVDVKDNGVGITPEMFAISVNGDQNHALKNINDRLSLAFGEKYGLELVEAGSSGTWIRIKTPVVWDASDFQNFDYKTGREDND